jgi:hypothetical protein
MTTPSTSPAVKRSTAPTLPEAATLVFGPVSERLARTPLLKADLGDGKMSDDGLPNLDRCF